MYFNRIVRLFAYNESKILKVWKEASKKGLRRRNVSGLCRRLREDMCCSHISFNERTCQTPAKDYVANYFRLLGGRHSTVVAFALRNPAAPGSNHGSGVFSERVFREKKYLSLSLMLPC